MSNINDDYNVANSNTFKTEAAQLEETILGSITINGCCCSAHNSKPKHVTKVSFNNKSYSDGHYKDGTIHITVGLSHNTNHPSPIDPNPLMHIQDIALLMPSKMTAKDTQVP
jgi:hypothetical protein